MEPPWDVGMKISSNVQGQMTKMASSPIYGKKTFKNLFLLNQETDDLETWYTALGTQVHTYTCTTKFVQMMTLQS